MSDSDANLSRYHAALSRRRLTALCVAAPLVFWLGLLVGKCVVDRLMP